MLSYLLALLLLPAFQVDAGYRIGPDDVIDVSVFGQLDLSGSAQVGSNGYITLQRIGPIQAAGLDSYSLARAIEDALRTNILVDPHVTVAIKTAAVQQVTVTGSVKSVGVFSIRRGQALLETLSKAGALAENAGPAIQITRPGSSGAPSQTFNIDTEALFEKADATVNIPLQNGDIINVSRGQPIFVNGEIKKPGEVLARYGKTALLRDVIQASGGPTDRAELVQITRTRAENNTAANAVNVRIEDLIERLSNEANVTVNAGDIVTVISAVPISVAGEVKRPGEIAARFGKSIPVRDVLQLGGGLTDRAGAVARIARPRTGRAGAAGGLDLIPVNLEDLIDKWLPEANVDVHPGDVVTVPPAVPITVLGEIRKPGDILVRRAVPLRDLLQQAGGLTERAGAVIRVTHPLSAAVQAADDNGAGGGKPVVETVSAEDLMERWAPGSNVNVFPGDTVTVTAGTPISLSGEVRKPGDIPTRLGKPVPLRDVIQLGNGVNDRAGNTIFINRGLSAPAAEPRMVSIKLDDLLAARLTEANVDVYPGDNVNVATALPIATVGELGKPGEFPVRAGRSITLKEAVLRSGGLTKTADKRKALIIRVKKDGAPPEYLPIDLNNVAEADFADQPLEPNDIVYVPPKKSSVAAKVLASGLSIAVAAATQRLVYFGTGR